MLSDRQKNFLYFGVSTLIIIGLVLLADVEKFISSVASARLWPLFWGVFSGVMAFTVLGFTWHRFLNRIDIGTTYWESFRLFMSGQFMNSVTPLGQLGGEPVMAYIVKDTEDTSYQKALSAVVSADIVNTVPFITFLLGGAAFMMFSGSMKSEIAQAAGATLMITLLGGTIVYLLWFRADFLEKMVQPVKIVARKTGVSEERVKGLDERVEELKESFDMIGENPKHLVLTAGAAHLFFLFQVAALFFVMASIGQMADFTSLYFVIAISSLANFSPTPGGSGTFELAMAGTLTAFLEVGFASAVTVGILYRVATYWSGLFIGYGSLISLRKGGSKLTRDSIKGKISMLEE